MASKGEGEGQKRDGEGRKEGAPSLSLEIRGSPGERPQGPGEVVQDPLTLEQILL